MSVHGRPGVGRVTALRRRLALDRNPMRGPADRARTWLGVLTIMLSLVAAPFVGMSVTNVVHHAQPRARPATSVGARSGSAAVDERVPSDHGAWRATTSREAFGAGEPGEAGPSVSRVRPHGTNDARTNAALCGVCAGAALVALAAVITRTGRYLLERKRLADWDTEWETVAPQWVRRY